MRTPEKWVESLGNRNQRVDVAITPGALRALIREIQCDAVADCYMMAKRELQKLKYNGYMLSKASSEESWNHIIRFCESAGAKSDILRNQVPTEIQGG